MNRNQVRVSLCLFAISCFGACFALDVSGQEPEKKGGSSPKQEQGKVTLKKVELGETKNIHQFGNVFLAGQFTPDDIALIKAAGVQTVITLRTDGEIDWDEASALKAAGITFVAVPFRKPDSLTDDVFNKVRKLMKDNADKKVMLHCGSANRVGAVWAACRVCDQGLPSEMAIKEAKQVGLRTPEYEARAKNYIQRHPKGSKGP